MIYLLCVFIGMMLPRNSRIHIPEDYGVEPADTTMTTWYDVTYKKCDYGYLMEVHHYKDGNDSCETVLSQYVYSFYPWERGFWQY